MLGIEHIAVHLPEGRADNRELCEQFDVDEAFLRDKIGVLRRAVKPTDEDTSDLCVHALESLIETSGVTRDSIDALIVVTQNPDVNLPHVSAMVHGRTGLSDQCAAFDISLGCSGYVYGLSVLQSFLAGNGLSRGVLITCDPYSKVVDPADRNTALLFGDAATATLVGPTARFTAGPFTFGTRGSQCEALICRAGRLQMNGREIFNFAATGIPGELARLLELAGLTQAEVDCVLLHQGSRYIVETIAKRARFPAEKVRFGIEEYGNTVSSSLPILLAAEMDQAESGIILMSGFGVGLSWASCVLKRVGE